MIQQSHSWAYIWTKQNLKRYMHPYAHSSTIYKSQDMETNDNRCPSTNEQIKKMWYIQYIQWNITQPFSATWMDLEIIRLSEVSQKERQIPYDITYMWNLKYDTNEHIYKTNRLTDIREQPCGCHRGGSVGEGRTGSLGSADADYYV